jgi:hypothetical protein
VTQASRHPLVQLQRIVGNQAVQRRIESERPSAAATESGGDIVDTRIELQRVDSVPPKPVLKERKVTYKEEKSAANTSLGTAESKLTIEYAVDEKGRISVGALRPEYIITIYTPYVSSEDFVSKFGPIMDKLWDEHDGNMQSFSESADVRNFNYEPQTRRHEEMHVASRQLALRDRVPDYLGFLNDNGLLDGSVTKFIEKTHFYWKVAWDERVKEIITHEQIYYLDVAMVEEYRQRASEAEPRADSWAASSRVSVNPGRRTRLYRMWGPPASTLHSPCMVARSSSPHELG